MKLRYRDINGCFGEHHIARTRVISDEHTAEHTHDFWEFFLVTKGRGWHFWNGRRLPLRAGSLAYIRASDQHSFQGARAEYLEFINLALAPRWWTMFVKLFHPMLVLERQAGGSPAGHRVLSVSETLACEQRLERLIESRGEDLGLLPEVVSGLVRYLLRGTVESASEEACPDWLARLVDDMRDPAMVAEPLHVWQKKSGRSPEHLTRSCRKYLGSPLTGLLNRARIEFVKAGLLREEDKVISLAYEAGYQNVGYFYRTFRKLEGCTPSEWLAARTDREVVPRQDAY